MKRLLIVAASVVALVLGVSVSAQAAGPDAHSIIMAKTGADATQVSSPQTVGSLTVGTGRDHTGKALATFTQRISANSVRMMATVTDASQALKPAHLTAQPEGHPQSSHTHEPPDHDLYPASR
jgi:hypothetical protein